MKYSYYENKWHDLQSQPDNATQIRHLARQIAYSFMDAYLKDCYYEQDYIDLLCEMTTYWEDPHLNGIAAEALFRIIIEALCDEFEDLQTETYNRVMAQLISFCRKLSQGSELDQCLNDFGLSQPDDLLTRIQRLRTDNTKRLPLHNIKKILLLSRVTIGADVAITSIVMQRLASIYSHAEIVLIGGSKLNDIYGANPRVNFRAVNYNRNGGLLERLASWHRVLEIVQMESAPSLGNQTILVDPDSRLSQLGVLPLISTDRYFFFDSRSDASLNRQMSMAELTNSWLDQVTDTHDFRYPMVWLEPDNTQKAAALCKTLKRNGACRLVAVNFGVGGNPRKRLGSEFEYKLIETILQEPQTIILLDQGSGDEERRYITALMDSFKEKGYPVRHTTFEACQDVEISSGVFVLETQIGEIAAIISESDEYIGYDSACQHIAAAAQTPCLTIFAGSNNMRFIRRWSAFGRNRCQIVHVDTLNDPGAIDIDDIIIRIMNERSVLLK
jgi:ADP-heptose:LPS heptosyltransferase